jgi:hypothetical protein
MLSAGNMIEAKRLKAYLINMIQVHGGNCTDARRAAEQSHNVHADLAVWDAAFAAYKAAGGCVGGGCE